MEQAKKEEQKLSYVYCVCRVQRKGSGTIDVGTFHCGNNITHKSLVDAAREYFKEQQIEVGSIMIHSINELSKELFESLTSEM